MSINFNFTGNLSSYEARLKVARPLLAPKVDKLSIEKHIFGANAETAIPASDEVVNSPFLRNLLRDFEVNDSSGLAVLRTQGGMGKTFAARIVLHYATRGLMFHGAGLRNPVYWRDVAQNLGLPDDLDPHSTEWIQVLVETVANGYDDTEQLSLVDKMIRSCTSMDTTLSEPNEAAIVLPDGVVFDTAQARAVIIFDDVNNLTPEDYTFFDRVYRTARGIPGIYCILLTQSAEIANALIDKNAWIKLNPLNGCYISNVDPFFDQVPEIPGHFPHPEWRVNWSFDELRALAIAHYDHRMPRLITIRQGMSPSALLAQCRAARNQWRASATS